MLKCYETGLTSLVVWFGVLDTVASQKPRLEDNKDETVEAETVLFLR